MRRDNTYPWVRDALTVIAGFAVAALVGILILVIGTSTVVLPHSFYPHECCHDKDCEALTANRIESVAGGYLIDGLLYVPERDARSSPDGRYHGCFPGNKTTVRCFWRPPMSM